MHKSGSKLHFKVMAFMYKFRDLLFPRRSILKEVEIQPGFHVLNYGCGPGGYLIPLAQLVGRSGRIHALDVNPHAIQMVQDIASRKRLENVETILSDCRIGLLDKSMDVVLLYDTFHDLSDPDGVLTELYRVLKPNGILSFSDHHMKKNEITFRVTERELFIRLSKRR